MIRKCEFCQQEKEVMICQATRIEGEYEMELKTYICNECAYSPSNIIWPKIQEKWMIKEKEKK